MAEKRLFLVGAGAAAASAIASTARTIGLAMFGGRHDAKPKRGERERGEEVLSRQP